jgi:hypothetical protein
MRNVTRYVLSNDRRAHREYHWQPPNLVLTLAAPQNADSNIKVGGILAQLKIGPLGPRAFDWAAVDLLPGTPFGDLFFALCEFAKVAGAFEPAGEAGRRPLPLKQLQADYMLAHARWPKAKTKQLAKLMHEHSRKVFGGRYKNADPDAIRKRLEKLLISRRGVEAFKAGLLVSSPDWFPKPEELAELLVERALLVKVEAFKAGLLSPKELASLSNEERALLATRLLKTAIASRRRRRRPGK